MQLTSEIGGEAIEREERRVGKQGTDTLFAGAIDNRRVRIGDGERTISDDSNRSGADLVDAQVAQKKNGDQSAFH